MKKTTKFWVLVSIGSVLIFAALVILAFGFEHLYCWYQQPVFIGPNGVEGKSLGFLITASFFFGATLIFGLIGALLLTLGFRSQKKALKKKN